MLQAKQAGQTFAVPEAPEPSNVVDIMDALRKSLQAAEAGNLRRPRAASKKPAEAPAEKEEARKPANRKAAARKAAR